MILAKVKGTVVCSSKDARLIGKKFLVVEEWDGKKTTGTGRTYVAIDLIGAGTGELILCTCGSAARIASGNENCPADMAVIGIVDDGTCTVI